MKQLSLREKVLLGIVGLTCIAVGLSFVFPTESKSSAPQAPGAYADLNEFTTGLAARIAQAELSRLDRAAIEKAAAPWAKDPFVNLRAEVKPPAKTTDQTPAVPQAPQPDKFSYSGYLIMGKRMLAVVNGMEYEVGEHLQDNLQMAVEAISPHQVVLRREDTGLAVVLPLEDE